MAKFIENKDGSRLIVSDDMPDIDYEEMESKQINIETENQTPDLPILLLSFIGDDTPKISIQCDKFSASNETAKISGLILLPDFAWIVENKQNIQLCSATLERLEKNYLFLNDCYKFDKISAKDINSAVAYVNLLLKRHI